MFGRVSAVLFPESSCQGRGKLSSQPEAHDPHVIVRRRRPSRRHRRHQSIYHALLIATCALLTLILSAIALQYVSPSLFRTSRNEGPSRQAVEASRDHFVATQQEVLHAIENRKVYRYSIVPGGVRDAKELKWAAEHDPVVAAHYAGFDYDHARVVRLTLARTVYVSYRIGNKVYWTAHRVGLKKGETVITDGKITARTRCANRVEELPQQATSQSEPPAAKFDEPVPPATGTAVSAPPVPFESSLMNRQPIPGLGPVPPLGLYDPFTGGMGVPIAPPALPSVCGIEGSKRRSGGIEGGIVVYTGKGKKKVIDPCENGGFGAKTPEPGTWLLMLSGLAAVYWKARHKFVRT